MDIVNVITTLDTHWTVLEAELIEIDKDLNHCYQFQRRYGTQYWAKTVTKLLNLKREKDNALRDIKLQMELFHLHIDSGRDLCRRLDRMQPMQRTSAHEKKNIDSQEEDTAPTIGEETYAIWSSILANADTIDDSFSDIVRQNQRAHMPDSSYFVSSESSNVLGGDYYEDDEEDPILEQ